MAQFTIVIEKSDTGVDASVPSIRECESWAATEDDAITAILDRLAYFIHRESGFKHILDFTREEDGKRYYKVIVK